MESLVSVVSFNTNIENSYTIPANVYSIGAYAFDGYMHLTELIIPDTVTEIQERGLNGLLELDYLFIPDSVISIGIGALHGDVIYLFETTEPSANWNSIGIILIVQSYLDFPK